MNVCLMWVGKKFKVSIHGLTMKYTLPLRQLFIAVVMWRERQAGAEGANRWPERGRQAASGWDGAAWICGHQGRPAWR